MVSDERGNNTTIKANLIISKGLGRTTPKLMWAANIYKTIIGVNVSADPVRVA